MIKNLPLRKWSVIGAGQPPYSQAEQVKRLALFLNNFYLDEILEKGRKLPVGKRFEVRKLDRLSNFILDVQELERISQDKGFPTSPIEKVPSNLDRRARRIWHRVAETLAKLRPVATLGLPSRDGWTVGFVVNLTHSKQRVYEYAVWSCVLLVAIQGGLRNLGKCTQCFQWFAKTRKKIHKFCSPECRDKAYRASPNAKLRNAERQRRYRANLKRRDAANLRVVGEKRGK